MRLDPKSGINFIQPRHSDYAGKSLEIENSQTKSFLLLIANLLNSKCTIKLEKEGDEIIRAIDAEIIKDEDQGKIDMRGIRFTSCCES